MTRCYFLPGIPGGELFFSGNPPQPYWADYSALLAHGVGPLALQADGVTDLDQTLPARIPNGPILSKYGAAMETLGYQLRQAVNGGPQWVVVGVGYDWRKDLIGEGKKLSKAIQQEVTGADPCTLVGHSMGGLVARAAWYDLNKAGLSNLVRRIVTMGTPHKGSYGPIRTWSSMDDTTSLIATATSYLNGIKYGIAGFSVLTDRQVQAITATWPSFYQLLPTFKPAGSDPPEKWLFEAYNYGVWDASVNVQQKWLDYAKNVWQPFLADPLSMPPPWVMTSVGSIGVSTPYRLNHQVVTGNPGCLDFSPSGDGTVLYTSSLATSGRQVMLNGIVHSVLTESLVNSGWLHPLILEQRSQDLAAFQNPNGTPWSVAVAPQQLYAQVELKPTDTTIVVQPMPPFQVSSLPDVLPTGSDMPGSFHIKQDPLPSPGMQQGAGAHC